MGCAADRVSDLGLGFRFSVTGWSSGSTIALSQGPNSRSHGISPGGCAGASVRVSFDPRVHGFDCEARAQPGFLAGDPMELAEKLDNLFAGWRGTFFRLARERKL